MPLMTVVDILKIHENTRDVRLPRRGRRCSRGGRRAMQFDALVDAGRSSGLSEAAAAEEWPASLVVPSDESDADIDESDATED